LGIDEGLNRCRFTQIQTELRELRVAYLKSLNTSTGVWLRVQELDGLPMESLTSLKVRDGEHSDKGWISLRNPILIMRCASLGVEQ